MTFKKNPQGRPPLAFEVTTCALKLPTAMHEAWKKEASRQGYSSLSAYIRDCVELDRHAQST